MKQNKFNLIWLLSALLLFCISLGATTTTFASENNIAVVAKNSRIYVPNGKISAYMRTKERVAKGTKVNLLSSIISNGRSFDEISNGRFILATNLKGKNRKLKNEVYIIFPDGGKLRKLKRHTRVMTYGLPVTGYADKKYYTEKSGRFIKKSAFIN